MPDNQDLPPLPESSGSREIVWPHVYTADQMRAYARLALSLRGDDARAVLEQARDFVEDVHSLEWSGSPDRRDKLLAAIDAYLSKTAKEDQRG